MTDNPQDDQPKAPLHRRTLLAGSVALPVTFVAGAEAAPARFAYDDQSSNQPRAIGPNEADPVRASAVATPSLAVAQARWEAVKSDPSVSPEALTEAFNDLRKAQHAARFAGGGTTA